MQLYSVPPQTHINFKQSLVHNLLTIISLLRQANQIEGLSDWIHHTAGRLQPLDVATFENIATMMSFSNGIPGYLTEKLSDGLAATDFGAMMEALESIDSTELQSIAIQSIYERALRQNVVGFSYPKPSGSDDLQILIQKMQAYHEEQWQLPPLSMPLDELVALYMVPDLLQDQLLMAFELLWHQFYGSRTADDHRQEREAINFHSRQNYGTDTFAVFRSVTGRTMPQRLQDNFGEIRTMTMIPSCHIGAYVVVSILGDHVWVGFNANYVPLSDAQHDPRLIAELYPIIRALADEARLKIVHYLSRHGEQNVGDIADGTHLSISTASRHLSLMQRTGILDIRREATMRYYKVNARALIDIGKTLQHLGEDVDQKLNEPIVHS